MVNGRSNFFNKAIKIMVLAATLCFVAGIASAQHIYVTKKGFIAAPTKTILKQAVSYITVKDFEAVAKLIENKRIIFLRSGAQVYIEKTELLKGMIQIRPVGETFAM